MVYCHIQQDQFLTPTFPLCTHSSSFSHTLWRLRDVINIYGKILNKQVYIWHTYCDCKHLMDAHVTAFAPLCSFLELDIAVSHQRVCVSVGPQSRSLTRNGIWPFWYGVSPWSSMAPLMTVCSLSQLYSNRLVPRREHRWEGQLRRSYSMYFTTVSQLVVCTWGKYSIWLHLILY